MNNLRDILGSTQGHEKEIEEETTTEKFVGNVLGQFVGNLLEQ